MKAQRKAGRKKQRARRRQVPVAVQTALVLQGGRVAPVQIPAIRMSTPQREPWLSPKATQRVIFGLAILAGAWFTVFDSSLSSVMRVCTALMTIAAAMLLVTAESRPVGRQKPPIVPKAPAAAGFVRWMMLTALLFGEWMLPHPGAVALWSFVFANAWTHTERPRGWRARSLHAGMALLALLALGRSVAASLFAAGAGDHTITPVEQIAAVVCIVIAAALPMISRRWVTHAMKLMPVQS